MRRVSLGLVIAALALLVSAPAALAITQTTAQKWTNTFLSASLTATVTMADGTKCTRTHLTNYTSPTRAVHQYNCASKATCVASIRTVKSGTKTTTYRGAACFTAVAPKGTKVTIDGFTYTIK
jgi:hypothetical protein